MWITRHFKASYPQERTFVLIAERSYAGSTTSENNMVFSEIFVVKISSNRQFESVVVGAENAFHQRLCGVVTRLLQSVFSRGGFKHYGDVSSGRYGDNNL